MVCVVSVASGEDKEEKDEECGVFLENSSEKRMGQLPLRNSNPALWHLSSKALLLQNDLQGSLTPKIVHIHLLPSFSQSQ